MADPIIVSFLIEDAGGKRKTLPFFVDAATTEAELQLFVDEQIPLLDPLLGGIFKGVTYTKPLDMGTPQILAVDDRLVESGALMTFAATGTKYAYGVFVPTVLDQYIENDRSVPDTGNVATWLAAFLGGASGAIATDQAGRALASFLRGTRKSRK